MKKEIKFALTAAPLAALVLLVAFAIYHIVSLAPRDNLILVKNATIEENITLDGLLFRNETVLTSSGDIKQIIANDGEKIAAGSVVAIADEEIKSDISGLFYSDIDGYESIFTADAALGIDVANFDKITTQNPFDDSKKAKPPTPSGAFGKIATEFDWYFAAKTDNADKFKAGEIYAASIGGADVTFELVKKSDGEKKSVLVFRCDRMPRELKFKRWMTAQVTAAVHSGTAVPSRAIYNIDKSKYIYIFDGGYARRRAINLIFEKDGICVIESKFIHEGDVIVIESGLYDGKVMH